MQLDPEFQMELLKALVAIAWADHRVVWVEVSLIRDLAKKLGLSNEQRAQVDVWLAQRESLPEPNYELLKKHKRAVLAALQTLVLADERIAPEEHAMLDEVEALLA